MIKGLYISMLLQISMYIQMFILVRTAFFLEGIQTIQFYHEEGTNTARQVF